MLTELPFRVTVTLFTPAFHETEVPGAQPIVALNESALMLKPAACKRLGKGWIPKRACCPASNLTDASPDAGRSKANNSVLHENASGDEVAEARRPRRSCCGSAALPDCCWFQAASSVLKGVEESSVTTHGSSGLPVPDTPPVKSRRLAISPNMKDQLWMLSSSTDR